MSHYRTWTEDEVWARVCRFAEDAQAEGRPIYTLTHKVWNCITEVQHDRIVRHSSRSVSDANQPTRADVVKVWRILMWAGRAGRRDGRTAPEGVPYFTFALMLAAMGEILEEVGHGQIAVKRHCDGE